MIRPVRRFALVVLLLLALGIGALAPLGVAAEEEPGATIHVLGGRVHALKAKGKPWDADHGSIPLLVYHQLGGISGFPPLTLLSLVPYRNRPDPYVVVEAKGTVLARSRAMQGTFLPAWGLRVDLPPEGERPSLVTFRVVDDDLMKDDEIGTALVDIEALLEKPGLHTVAGTGGLHDLSLVVRNPKAPSAGPEARIEIRAIHVKARPQRPAGGDWDAGGNPLKRRFPRLRIPKELEGLETVRPDLKATVTTSEGASKTSGVAQDALELTWPDVGLAFSGRAGVGDGLYLTVIDEDLVLSDPVGVVYVPFERFLEAREKGVLTVEGDEENGVAEVEIAFAVE